MLRPPNLSTASGDNGQEDGDEEVPDVVNPQLMLDLLEAKRKDPSAFVSGWMENDETGVIPDEDVDKDPGKQLLRAAEQGDMKTVVELLSRDADLVNARDRDQYTPLHRAAYGNHVAVMRHLISRGADVAAKTVDNWQPLHSAARWANLEATKVLIHFGKADVNARTRGNLTPLHLAASEANSLYVAEYLLSQPNVDPHVKSNSGETAKDVARRTSNAMLELFEGAMG